MVELAENGVTVRAIHPPAWYDDPANGRIHVLNGIRYEVIEDEDPAVLRGRIDRFASIRIVTTFLTSMEQCFEIIPSIKSYHLHEWDVSNVTNMRRTFMGCAVIDADLSHWDVSNVTDMTGIF